MANKDTSKQWFEKGDYPTQEQFAQTFDWLRWKDEGISIEDVANLQNWLNILQANLNSIIPNAIIRGGQVTIKSDDGTNVVLQIDATDYALKGIKYSVPHSEITITRPADNTKSRFDVFYLDATGFHVLTGVESAAPVKPQLQSGMELTTILIGFDNNLDPAPMPGTPNLQQVTLAGNKTTTPLISKDSLQAGQAATEIVGKIKAYNLTADREYQLPDKDGTLALLDDVTGAGAVIDDAAPSSVKVYSSQKTEDIAATKVNVVAGKGLSTEDYTTDEKTKLAGLESSHFKGLYPTLPDLQTAFPAANAGDYADVDAGTGSDTIRYVWDVNDAKWVESGSGAPLTAAQVKSLYESNPDTNALTDTLKTNLQTAYGWGNHAAAGYYVPTWGALVKGDILYVDATGNLVRLPVDADGKFLTLAGGLPVWGASAAAPWSVNGSDTFYDKGNVMLVSPTGTATPTLFLQRAAASGPSPSGWKIYAVDSGGGDGGTELRFIPFAGGTEWSSPFRLNYGGNSFFNRVNANIISAQYSTGYFFIDNYCSNKFNYNSAFGNVNAFQVVGTSVGNNSTSKYRGFYYAPVVGSVVNDYRGFENTVGNNFFNTVSGSTGIGVATVIDQSAIFQVTSTTKGMLQPRMMFSEWDSIATPAEGLMAWNTSDHAQMWFDGTDSIGFRYNRTTSKFQGYDGTNWIDLN